MKKVRLTAALGLVLLLGGCKIAGNGFDPQENTIYVSEDRTLSTATVEACSPETYSADELRTFVEQAVTDYNEEKIGQAKAVKEEGQEKLPVAVRSCEIEEGQAVMILDYASSEDLVNFGTEAGIPITGLTVSDVSEATGIEQSLKKAGSGEKVSADAVAASEGTLVQTDGPAVVQTDGKILYVTDGAEVTGDRTVRLPEGGGAVIFE